MYLADACRPGVGVYFPPKIEILLAWSTLFKCKGTFTNYLGYVRTGCLIAKAPAEARVFEVLNWECACLYLSCQVLDDAALKRAKLTIDKAKAFERRKAMFIKRLGSEWYP